MQQRAEFGQLTVRIITLQHADRLVHRVWASGPYSVASSSCSLYCDPYVSQSVTNIFLNIFLASA
jgi:hypothetical protein